MRKILSGVPFCTHDNYTCFYMTLDSVFQFHGYHLSDILFDRWTFSYRRTELGAFHVTARDIPLEACMAHHGIFLAYRQTDDRQRAWTEVKRHIDEGKPVPVGVDPYYLEPYFSNRPQRHGWHYVIVCGYDEHRRTAHIVDPSPWERLEVEVSMESLQEARDSAQSERRNLWLELRFPPERAVLDGDKLRHVLRENIGRMLHPPAQGKTLFHGVGGIRRFAEEVNAWRGDAEEVLVAKMRRGFDELGYVALERDGHSDFLSSATEILEEEKVTHFSGELKRIAQGWYVPRNMFFKGSKKDPLGMLPRIHRKLMDIADREEQVLIALKEAIKT